VTDLAQWTADDIATIATTDAAYRAKYHENSGLVMGATAQRATVEIQLA
jgi:hypothetical protein